MKSKTIKSSKMAGPDAGKGHMFGKGSAGPQKAGQAASMGRGGGKFAKGGSGKMFGKGSAKPGSPA